MDKALQFDRVSEDGPSLDGLIHGLRHRLRLLVACRGAALTLAAAITLSAAACAVDWWLRIEQPWLRATLAGSIVVCSVVVALRSAILPLLQSCNPVDLALEIERRRPEWRDLLASSVEFSRSGCSAHQGAPALQQQSVARAIARWNASDDRAMVNPRPCRRAIALASLACVLALTAIVSNQSRAHIALQRLCSPYACPDWPRRHNLALFDTGFQRLSDPQQVLHFATGSPALIYVDDLATKLPDDVRLHLAAGDGQVRVIPLKQAAVTDAVGLQRSVCLALLPADPLNYAVRVTGGDDDSMPWYTVAFSPQPDVTKCEMSYRPPSYLGRPEVSDDGEPGVRDLFVGTHVRLAATANVPLQSAVFRRDGRLPQDLVLSPDGRRFTVEFDIAAAERFSFWFDLTDQHGLRGDDPQRVELRGVADAAPVVTIEQPAVDLTATPAAEIPLRIVARDDVGVTRARLLLSDPAGSVEERSLPLAVQSSPHTAVNTTLPMAGLALAAGRQLTLRAEAEDAYDLGPRHVGSSRSRKLTVVTPEEKRQELLVRQSGLVQGLERASGIQSRSLQQTRELKLQWQGVRSFQPADIDLLKRVTHDQLRIVAELGDEEFGVAGRAGAILEEFRWNKIDDPAAAQRLQQLLAEIERLRSDVFPVTQQSLDRACKFIDERAPPGAPADVDVALKTATAAQSEAADTLDALLVLFAEWQRQYDLNRRADEILAAQVEIGDETAATGRRTLTRKYTDLSPQDQADLARLAERQMQLSGAVRRFTMDIDKMLADSASKGQGLSESELRDALNLLRAQSVADAMQRSGELMGENRIGDSLLRQQAVQKSLVDLGQILKGLGALDPETLLKRVREAEQSVETLRRQQADVMHQTRTLTDSAAAAIVELRERQQSLRAQTAETALRLRRQQLHRAASSTSRAADAMQRAAKLLNDESIPPSADAQQDAVDGLVQAQRELADVRRQLEISQSAVRFFKLVETVQALENRQQGLREETGRLAVQKRERGSLSRSQLSTLLQLAQSQEQLLGDTEQTADTVADAPVLSRAFTSITAEMQRAATRLADREIDAPTQAAQDNAVRRLHQLSAVLAESQETVRTPDAATSAPDAQDQVIPDLTLVAQVRLIARMQADLAERAAALTDTARRMPELTPEQQIELSQLAGQQAELTEWLEGLLVLPEANSSPGIDEAQP